MSSENDPKDPSGLDRRHFITAAGAGLAAASLGTAGIGGTASAKTIIPSTPLKMNATKGGKRVAILNDALLQIGPPLARKFA